MIFCRRSSDNGRRSPRPIALFWTTIWASCLRCNGLLRPVEKEAVLHRLEPKTKRYFDEFRICETCGQIYWQGSHFARLQGIVDRALARQ